MAIFSENFNAGHKANNLCFRAFEAAARLRFEILGLPYEGCAPPRAWASQFWGRLAGLFGCSTLARLGSTLVGPGSPLSGLGYTLLGLGFVVSGRGFAVYGLGFAVSAPVRNSRAGTRNSKKNAATSLLNSN